MKNLKKVLALVLVLVMVLSLAACGSKGETNQGSNGGETSGDPHIQGKVSQGITEDSIKIGSIYGTSGANSFIGIPVVQSMEAVFCRVNANGGIGGKKIDFVHYDDGWDAATAAAFVEKLAEEDKVFAFNGLTGLVVDTSLEYLEEIGIPVVYIISTNSKVFSADSGSTVFPVQPNGMSDGAFLVARCFNEAVFGPNKDQKLPSDAKVGVFVGTDQASQVYIEAMKGEAEKEGRLDDLLFETVTADTYATAIEKLKAEGCQALISIMLDSKGCVAAMDDAKWLVPYFAFYSASTTASFTPETYDEARPIYFTGWGNYVGEEGERALADLDDCLSYNPDISEADRASYLTSGYSYAGFFCGKIMETALRRIADHGWDWTWDNLVEALEEAPIKMDACGGIDYANGQRMGVTDMMFGEYYIDENGQGATRTLDGFRTVDQVAGRA